MIVNVEGIRHIGVPIVLEADGKPVVSRVIDLCPSYSEIDDALWVQARVNALPKIEAGIIKEEWTKVARDEAKDAILKIDSDIGTETAKCRIPAKLADITRLNNKVIEVVKATYHIPTLENWYKTELRQDVRVELQEQIRRVNSGEIKG